MLQLKILHPVQTFADEFARCCRAYESLHFATAWCGNPKHVIPYELLKTFRGEITATIGRHFDETHPDGLAYLLTLKGDVRVFRKEVGLFHPKVYLFSSGQRVAAFIGSSNLTFSGFYSNVELNVLLEGLPDEAQRLQVVELRKQLLDWHTDVFSFVPDVEWMTAYRRAFYKALKEEKMHRIETAPLYETSIASASWLQNATWELFYKKVAEGLERANRTEQAYINVLDRARNVLSLPWNAAVFSDEESRRIILGTKSYGWLGHVGASGAFRKMLARGTQRQHQAIVEAINNAGSLNPPVDWRLLGEILRKLVGLGPTMKVWSRLLCLVRPDVYCTVASDQVRANLSKTLNRTQKSLGEPPDYIELLKLVHASPWFRSPMPIETTERAVWRCRVAFLDAIFYSQE